MGQSSRLCIGCGTPVNRGLVGTHPHGEECVIMHIRHGAVLGEVSGEYDGFLRVVGDTTGFNRPDPTGQNPNSLEEILRSLYMYPDSPGRTKALGFQNLHPKPTVPRSGLEMWHKRCYIEAPEELKAEHRISADDPQQGMGDPRPEFMAGA